MSEGTALGWRATAGLRAVQKNKIQWWGDGEEKDGSTSWNTREVLGTYSPPRPTDSAIFLQNASFEIMSSQEKLRNLLGKQKRGVGVSNNVMAILIWGPSMTSCVCTCVRENAWNYSCLSKVLVAFRGNGHGNNPVFLSDTRVVGFPSPPWEHHSFFFPSSNWYRTSVTVAGGTFVSTANQLLFSPCGDLWEREYRYGCPAGGRGRGDRAGCPSNKRLPGQGWLRVYRQHVLKHQNKKDKEQSWEKNKSGPDKLMTTVRRKIKTENKSLAIET